MSAEYPKINSIFKRDQRGRFIVGDCATPEIEYLYNSPWQWTEKVDGANIRLNFEHNGAEARVTRVQGRTDNAQIPPHLLERLTDLLRDMPLEEVFHPLTPVTLYGEGYGAKIQKGGGNYIPDGCDFVLFDVKVGDWWLRREAVEDVAHRLGLRVVPVVMTGTISDAIKVVKDGFASEWDGVRPEGLVGRPVVDLFNRKGERIVTKIKHKDFDRA